MKTKTFSEKVVECALAIPKGRVTTYGRIARAAGAGPMASQSVTAVLGKAYHAGEDKIPFHRIVYADGHIWVSRQHKKKRLELYKREGIRLDPPSPKASAGQSKKYRIVDFREKIFEYL